MKAFVTLTLVRVKNPLQFQPDPSNPFTRRREPRAEDMETVNTHLRTDAIFSVTSCLASISPPLANTLVGVNGIGEFMVMETRAEVLAAIEGTLDESHA